MTTTSRRHLRSLPAALAAAVLIAGCGTRMTHAEIRSAAGTVARGATSSPDLDISTPGPDTSALPAAPPLPGSAEPVGRSTGTSSTSPAASSAHMPAAATAASAPPAAASRSQPKARTGNTAAQPAPASAGSAAGAPIAPPTESAAKSPVKIGNVGTYSGLLGAFYRPGRDALQAWQKTVNARGGVNGHPVELVLADDQSDQARHRSLVQQLVEQNKVLAFVANMEGVTGAGTVDYLTKKRIPVIGTDTGGTWMYDSPMYFPQASSGGGIVEYAVASPAKSAVAQGRRKAGVLTCTEAQVCRDIQGKFPILAKKYGLESVYQGQASVAQPDFTAECLAAQRAGVEVLVVGFDVGSVNRIGTSCARQGFHPMFASTTATNSQAEVPEMDGLWGSTSAFPWFQATTPATQEYQAASRQFGLTKDAGPTSTAAWAAGKLFERAARNLPEPPTTDAILDGLWSLQNDTLGGLVPPLTFVRDRPATPRTCWFAMVVKDRRWESPDNFTPNCV
jgi:branched-chain amino acid transport system substrate-binding protein